MCEERVDENTHVMRCTLRVRVAACLLLAGAFDGSVAVWRDDLRERALV